MKDSAVSRLYIVGAFIFIFAILLLSKLFFLQVVKAEYYRDKAKNQYVAKNVDKFDRGSIYFKKKDKTLISAASLKDGFLAAIKPADLENEEEAYQKLSQIIEIEKEDFIKKAGKKEDPYEEIARRLNQEQAGAIRELDIPAVGIFPDRWRFYPAQNLASHLLGFVGYKDSNLTGRYGIEEYYNNVLEKHKTNDVKINSFAEILLGYGKQFLKKEGNNDEETGDIILTIEPEVERILENALLKTKEKWEASLAGGIIINPKTGEILAMAAKPDFNPNLYFKESDYSLFINPNVESIFEFGSIMKPLTVAAGLNEKAISPETTYFDKGYRVFGSSRIENYDAKGRGRVTMQTVLDESLNTGAVFIMERIGKQRFYNYIKEFGLGEKSGIDLPGEVKGLISNLESNRDIEYATASFGQGIATSPIAMTRALSLLANGGKLVKPYIASKIGNASIKPVAGKTVLEKEASEKTTRMLVATVDNALLAGTVKLKNYSVAAKTGTAQLPKKDGRGYEEGKYLHSFFGYAPAFDPQFLIFLYLKEPVGVRYASQTLTAPFFEIVKFLLNYYQIPPDR
jgi:cell division protein FtsI/penicillin-binding protein 2